jgi:Fe-S cluster biogenesis protein NfuA
MFVLTEHTPNPDALKFVPHVKLTAGSSRWFEPDRFAPEESPLAARLFELDGVRRVFIAPDFVTVTRSAAGPGWPDLRYPVIAAIAEHLEAGRPVMTETAPAGPQDDGEDEIVSEILQVLGRHVRPGVARDGGDVLFESFDPDTGVVRVRMQGACGGCPSSRLTLKAGIEQILRRYVPEVTRVEEAVPAEPAEPPAARWKALAKAAGEGARRARTLFTHGGQEIRKEKA